MQWAAVSVAWCMVEEKILDKVTSLKVKIKTKN